MIKLSQSEEDLNKQIANIRIYGKEAEGIVIQNNILPILLGAKSTLVYIEEGKQSGEFLKESDILLFKSNVSKFEKVPEFKNIWATLLIRPGGHYNILYSSEDCPHMEDAIIDMDFLTKYGDKKESIQNIISDIIWKINMILRPNDKKIKIHNITLKDNLIDIQDDIVGDNLIDQDSIKNILTEEFLKKNNNFYIENNKIIGNYILEKLQIIYSHRNKILFIIKKIIRDFNLL